MIPKKKKEYTPTAMELCPRYNRCNANLCPLDPDMDEHPYVHDEEKCKANKPTRLKIAEDFLEVLPYKGFTKREFSGRKTWDNRDPKEKKRFAKSNTKRLKTLKKVK